MKIKSVMGLGAALALLFSILPDNASAQQTRRSRRAARTAPQPQVAQPVTVAEEPTEAIDPTVQPLEYAKEEAVRGGLLPRWFRKVKVDGAVEASYTYNDKRPRSSRNSLRGFDQRHDAGTLNQVQIRAQKEATDDSPVGFGLRLNAGSDANVFQSREDMIEDNFEVQEAYGAFRLPFGRGVTVKAGKLPSPVGAEVIEMRDNYNISRGFLFGLFQPATVTGVRVEAPVTDTVAVSAGVIRGWDVAWEDNNSAASVEAKVSYTPTDKTSLSAAVVTGPEQDRNNSNQRTLLDVVLNHRFSDTVEGFVNANYITEEGASATGGGADAAGVAVGVRKHVTEKLSVAGRVEVVNDTGGAVTGERQSLGSGTVTGEYKFRKNVIGRLEYRHDTSSDSSYEGQSRLHSNQNTVAAAMIITF